MTVDIMYLKCGSVKRVFHRDSLSDKIKKKEKAEAHMKYLVIGAGGTGGSIGAYMTEAGKDVTLIARGEHLKKMQEQGLKMETTKKGNYTVHPVKAADMENYDEHPDIIFVCVKGYSLEETIPFIRRVAKENTVVIPILNIYGTGGRMQEKLPELLVTDGCIYIAAEIKEPGTIWQNGDIFRVVYGTRKKEDLRPACCRRIFGETPCRSLPMCLLWRPAGCITT